MSPNTPPPFDPADFDRRLNALLEIAASQSASLQEMEASHKRDHQRTMAQIQAIIEAQNRDAEHINALVRIAEAHERRISELEGDEPTNGTPE